MSKSNWTWVKNTLVFFVLNNLNTLPKPSVCSGWTPNKAFKTEHFKTNYEEGKKNLIFASEYEEEKIKDKK